MKLIEQELQDIRSHYNSFAVRSDADACTICRLLDHIAALEAEGATLRNELEDMVNQFAYEGKVVDGITTISTGGLSALEGAFAALGYDDPQPMPHKQCQVDGCTKHANGGTPTPDGYKFVCGNHWHELQQRPAAPKEGE